MSIGFFNLAMLLGLVTVAIPPLIHLLNRRRYDVVDWGAMRFLEISEVTRRRILIEELILMLIRMGLIALMVLALAGPFLSGVTWVPDVGGENRDVVIILDGSASMTYESNEKTTHERATKWVEDYLDKLRPGDGVALIQARETAVPVVPSLSTDPEQVREKLAEVPAPSGSADWTKAIQEAEKILEDSTRARRDIILLSDNQRYGWADEESLLRWEDLAAQASAEEPQLKPRVWVVNPDPNRPEKVENLSLAPITATRAVVARNQTVTFQTAILLHGATYKKPYRLRLFVDGKLVKSIAAPEAVGGVTETTKGQVPLRVRHKFNETGSHLVSLVMEPDPPIKERPKGYKIKDHLAIDNRQDFAVEVVEAIPVLMVDGDESPDPPFRESFHLRDALAQEDDPAPVIQVQVLSIKDFRPMHLTTDIEPENLGEIEPGDEPQDRRPRVLILHNVKELNQDQREAIETFLDGGNGVFVTLGGRVDTKHYNDNLYREGKGWLPARLVEIKDANVEKRFLAQPRTDTFFHPALEMFRPGRVGRMGTAIFNQWWQLSTPLQQTNAGPIAMFNHPEAPFLIEGTHKGGRVIVSAVPLDRSWQSPVNLIDLPDFVPFAHELVYYLASARSAQFNLEPGHPLRYRLPNDSDLEGFELTSPSGERKPLKVNDADPKEDYAAELVKQEQHSTLVHEGMRESGIWKLTTPEKRTVYYAVQADRQEADLTPAGEEDRKLVGKHLDLSYENDVNKLVERMSEEDDMEVWWWFLIGMMALLCAEVWMTRRIVRGRAV